MKLLTFYKDNELCLGVKTEKGILDVTAGAAQGVPRTMDDFINGGEESFKALSQYVAEPGPSAVYLDEDSLKIGPCIPRPTKIVGVGLNYCTYMKMVGAEKPEFPHLFNKFSDAVRGQDDVIYIPANSDQVDFEGELVIVIGKPARMVSEEDALDYVLGYCITNDVSARDFQNATTSWVPGKCCDSFAPIGPYLVTADEIPDPNKLQIKSYVNGELRQDFNTDDMIRDCRFLISGISKYFTLKPGDILLTGTNDGIIMTDPEDKREWLKDGDILEVEIEGLGLLRNKVKKEVIKR